MTHILAQFSPPTLADLLTLLVVIAMAEHRLPKALDVTADRVYNV